MEDREQDVGGRVSIRTIESLLEGAVYGTHRDGSESTAENNVNEIQILSLYRGPLRRTTIDRFVRVSPASSIQLPVTKHFRLVVNFTENASSSLVTRRNVEGGEKRMGDNAFATDTAAARRDATVRQ